MNSRLCLACLTTVLLAVGACSTSTAGHARRASSTSAGPTRSASSTAGAPPSSTTNTGATLEETDPCALITREEAERVLGRLRQDPEPRTLGSATTCRYSPETATVILAVRTNVGLTGVQANGGEIKETSVGGRPAKELLDATGSCGIYLGVTDRSRVDVVVNATSSGREPCPIANRVAEVVEPRLP
ncbi:DUF3558 domain-containing protein [Actinosynnema sp. NPDC023587]|uniref:DUF3558 domain-containing protein n=1 Tax=Actinosynnema sp. NPDC023587 TaxID=3154695 RepID=UPI00341011E3